MKVLITGGAGFIGSRLALALIGKGHQVRVLDALTMQVHGPDPMESALYRAIVDKVEFVRGDVTDRPTLTAALAGQEVIVHLAAETGTGQSMYAIERYTAVNIQATASLLDILANEEHSVRRVVIASSRSVYGEGKYLTADGTGVYPGHRAESDMLTGDFEVKYRGQGGLTLVATDEESKLHPSSVYGITKLVQEQLVMTVCPTIGLEAVAFRYQNVFGPGQSLSNPYTGILSIFSNLVMGQKGINIFEDGLESRDFVYIEDVVAATVLGVEHPAAANEVFNVGTGVAVSVKQVAETIARLMNANPPMVISGNFRLGDIPSQFRGYTKNRKSSGV